MASTEMDYLQIGMGYRDLNDISDLVREKEEKRLREERNIDQALDTFELYDDALAIVHINDDTYSYTSASPSLQLLGLTDDDNALQSFFRLLRLHKSIEQETAPRPDIRLLEDGMLNATPQ